MAKPTKNKGASAPATPATQAATPAPAQAVATPAKVQRPALVVQHGVARPRAGGLCAAVWEITEANALDGQLPPIATVKAKAAEAGLNPTNVSIEYYRCRQWHGVRGRAAKPTEQEQA